VNVALLVTAALLFATGGLFMKQSDGLTRLYPSLVVFLLFCAGAACQTLAMRRNEMGTVYILVLGLEALAAFALSIFLAGEKPTTAKITALILIVAGIILLKRT
jgi:quaternary ammonium compound-resistance protein SugE